MPANSAAATTDLLTITVPRASAAARVRSPLYVSPASQSAEVDVLYGTTSVVGATVNFVANNGVCVTVTGGLQCTLGVLVQPSATDFLVKLFDQLNEQGNLLSAANVAVPPSPNGAPVTIPVTLAGVVAQIGLALVGGAFSTGTPGTRALVVTPMDADGNPIAGTLDQPIALTSANPAIVLSVATVSAAGTPVTLTYNGSGSSIVQITATDPDGGTQTLTVPLPGGQLGVTPGSLTFSFLGQTQNVTVSEPGYAGAYSVSGCSGVATYGTVTNGTLSVTAVAPGSCTITVSDTNAHSAAIAVGVSALTVPIQ